MKIFAAFFSLLIPALLTAQSAPILAPIQGPQVVCVSPFTAFTYSTSGTNNPSGFSWTLTPNNGAVLTTINNISAIIFPPLTGVYLLSVSASNSFGTSNVVTMMIQAFEKPNVTFSGVTNFCQGSSTFLMASPTMQSSSTTLNYTWSPTSGISSPYSPGGTFNPTATTNYVLTMSNGPCTNTAGITINVNPKPTITASSNYSVICEGESALLSLSGGVDPYLVNGINASATSVISPTQTTVYTITGTNPFGCSNTTSFTQHVEACVSIKTQSRERGMVLYPNPNLGNFKIKAAQTETAQLVNQLGQNIRQIYLQKEKETAVTDLEPGVYFVVTQSSTIKVIVYR